MTTLNPGDTVIVTVDSSVNETERGTRYQWVRYEGLEGLMNLRSTEAPIAVDEEVKVEIIPKGNLGKDFKCKIWIAAAIPPKQKGSSPASKAEPVIDQGDLKQYKFSVPRGTPLADLLERKTDEWQARYGGSAEIARGRWLTEVLG